MSPMTVLTVLAICCGVAIAQSYDRVWPSNNFRGNNFLDNSWNNNDFQNDWRLQSGSWRNNFVGSNRWNNRRMLGSRFVNRYNRRTYRPSTGELISYIYTLLSCICKMSLKSKSKTQKCIPFLLKV